MTKEHILSEIKRMAKENRGFPLGKEKFTTLTGIKTHDWYGRYWTKWSDALKEAGFSPNQMVQAYSGILVIEKFISLMRNAGKIPTSGDIRLKARTDKAFPSHTVFNRFGSKKALLFKVVQYCETHAGFDDILLLCSKVALINETENADHFVAKKVGFVYLFKHGLRREYKIGKTLNPLRREGEIGIQLPDELQPVHHVKTDDPSGVEAYWHSRFKEKRKKGEWFVLTPFDTKAFKRWRSIY